MPDQKDAPSGGAELLVRFYWMFIGNALLLFSLIFIVEKRPGLPSLYDAGYGIALGSLIILRYVDIRFLKGETGDGKPATMAHWRRYALLVGAVGVGAWLLVRLAVHGLK